MKNKHCELIKKWAEGAEIEIYDEDIGWIRDINPYWFEHRQYRVRHKHQEFIDAFERGETIQTSLGNGLWATITAPAWFEHKQYRVRHKHQEFIDAFERGETIQSYDYVNKYWGDVKNPIWIEWCEYRIKNKHQEFIDAFDAGKRVEYFCNFSKQWFPVSIRETFNLNIGFRIVETDQIKIDIDDIMTNFDFHRVETTMKLLKWTWLGSKESPNTNELRKKARHLLEIVAKNVLDEQYDGEYATSCGGFLAVARKFENNGKIYLKLSFEIENWDNWD